MDKSLLVFIAIGLGAFYLLINFLGDIEEEDSSYKSHEYKRVHQYDQYKRKDSIGQTILVFDANVDAKTQMDAWNTSGLKKEFLKIFPDYGDMKIFIKERIRGDAFQSKMLKAINDAEGQFFSGTLDSEQAKHMLDSIK